MCFNFWQHYQVMKYHSKVPRKHFWMMLSAKNEAFGHYLEFGLLDWLDIAYDDRIMCFPPFGNTTRSWMIVQNPQKCVFKWYVQNWFLALIDLKLFKTCLTWGITFQIFKLSIFFRDFSSFQKFWSLTFWSGASRFTTLQFSTSVERQLVLLVSWVVIFLKNGSKDFFDFLHEVSHR